MGGDCALETLHEAAVRISRSVVGVQKPGPPPPEPALQPDPRGWWGGSALSCQPPLTTTPGGTVLHTSSGFCPFEGTSIDSC